MVVQGIPGAGCSLSARIDAYGMSMSNARVEPNGNLITMSKQAPYTSKVDGLSRVVAGVWMEQIQPTFRAVVQPTAMHLFSQGAIARFRAYLLSDRVQTVHRNLPRGKQPRRRTSKDTRVTPSPIPRRGLLAVLAADVAGYTRLMERAEDETHRRLMQINQRIVLATLAEHDGTLVKHTGDGFCHVQERS